MTFNFNSKYYFRSKSSTIILCILVLSNQILSGLSDDTPDSTEESKSTEGTETVTTEESKGNEGADVITTEEDKSNDNSDTTTVENKTKKKNKDKGNKEGAKLYSGAEQEEDDDDDKEKNKSQKKGKNKNKPKEDSDDDDEGKKDDDGSDDSDDGGKKVKGKGDGEDEDVNKRKEKGKKKKKGKGDDDEEGDSAKHKSKRGKKGIKRRDKGDDGDDGEDEDEESDKVKDGKKGKKGKDGKGDDGDEENDKDEDESNKFVVVPADGDHRGKGKKGDEEDDDFVHEEESEDDDDDDGSLHPKENKKDKGGSGKKGGVWDDDSLSNIKIPKASKIGGIAGSGSQIIRKKTMSGLARVVDDRFAQIDRIGDPHSGMPEDALGHLLYCVQFIYSGLFCLVFLFIRFPLKILMKVIVVAGLITHLLMFLNRCINPLTILGFATWGRKHNARLGVLAPIKHKFKTRLMWLTDKCEHQDRQMYGCCSYHEMKTQMKAQAPELNQYLSMHFLGVSKLIEIVFCMKYQESSQACEEVDLTPADYEPDRVVPLTMYTAAMEVFDRYI